MTRAAPARLLGLADRGHLGPGALADIAVYDDQPGPDRDVPQRASRLQERRARRARRRSHQRPLRAGRSPCARRRPRHARAALARIRRALRPPARGDGRARVGGRRHAPARTRCSRTCHAGADPQRRRGRRHLRRGLRHARDGDRHHRRHARLGAPGGGDDDRLRHLGDRLRLRGRHRPRARCRPRRRTRGPASACCCSPSRPAMLETQLHDAGRPVRAHLSRARPASPASTGEEKIKLGAAIRYFGDGWQIVQALGGQRATGASRSWTASSSARRRRG